VGRSTDETPTGVEPSLADRIASLEKRVARMEEQFLRGGRPGSTSWLARLVEAADQADQDDERKPARDSDELEFRIGQAWFAKIGIVVLALGVAFALAQPYPQLPAWAPTAIGYALSLGLFGLARAARASFELVSRYLRGSGLVLLFFATLRLSFFGGVVALAPGSAGSALALAVVVVGCVAVSLRWASPYLTGISIAMGYVGLVATGSTWVVLPGLVALAGIGAYARARLDWPRMMLAIVPAHYLAYLLWATDDPELGPLTRFVTEPVGAVFALLLSGAVFAAGTAMRRDRPAEGFTTGLAAVLNGGACYGLFLLHTVATFGAELVWLHLLASAMFLGLSVAFFTRDKSIYSTFVYSMLGYSALSAAIIAAVSPPAVFVWLSLQSIVVVATAVWFRSKIIVLANFFIFLAIVLGYAIVAKREDGMSVVFGVTALLSARILNWQKDRLDLRTESMRNAYLVCAFVAFPYALAHLVPRVYVSLSWVGIALGHYLLNQITRVQKYRWMGHFTLLLTVLYVVVIGIARLPPIFRVASFLVLGSVLIVVSLIFTKLRLRARGAPPGPAREDPGEDRQDPDRG